MPEKKYYSPAEAIAYLNEKFHPQKPINYARLGRLRREKRIHGEKIAGIKVSFYTRKALEMVTFADLEDKRKTRLKTP